MGGIGRCLGASAVRAAAAFLALAVRGCLDEGAAAEGRAMAGVLWMFGGAGDRRVCAAGRRKGQCYHPPHSKPLERG